jgi:hypothetical protein
MKFPFGGKKMNPFEEKPQKIEKSFQNWKNVLIKPYDKHTVDPYTRLRIILMDGTEFESVRFGHSYTRNCTNNDIRRELALIRRSEQIQQKRIASLKPMDENILEHTIGYEQLAVDLTANLAKSEKNDYVRQQLNFALLEDFDHLYRYSDLMELEKSGDPALLVGDYTEIMPGRPTVAEYRHPFDDVKFNINSYLNNTLTRLHVNIITAAEQQTMNYYMNVANLYVSDLGRKLYNEIAMIEEQHVTGYGSLKDSSCTWLENLVMNEYTECYLYYSCYEDEKDPRIKKVWEQHFTEEISHLHKAAELLLKYEGKVWQQLFPEGGDFPELLKFRSQKEYIREVLKSVRLTAVEEGFRELSSMPDNFRYFSYNKGVNGNLEKVGTHSVINLAISEFGKDYRIENKAHPVEALSKRTKDNTDVGRVKDA